ncbi:MAG: hypothetical protein B7C24_06690 [Bacteroidetes bacterium 4572_77]|nr:MAG: hypothetical protein B7C24_06690 [Bacteroidetes bacterium 4572_77]
MQHIKVLLLYLLIFFQAHLLAQPALVLDNESPLISLSQHAYHYEDFTNQQSAKEIYEQFWLKKDAPITFSSNKNIQWIKHPISNPYPFDLYRYLFIPYHYIFKIDVFTINHSNWESIAETGIKRDFKNKSISSRGYPIRLCLKKNSTTDILIKYDHRNRPLRAAAFLMTTQEINETLRDSEHVMWFWRGFLLFALIISFTLYVFVKLRLFLYYFFLNIGVGIFIASHIGDFFIFFDKDSSDLTGLFDYTGAIIMNIVLPLFLNRLTPIKKRNPIIWKLNYTIIFGMIILWCLSLFPSIRMSSFNYFTHFYIMIGSAIVFGIQPILLAKGIYYKDKNAILIFFIYGIYVSSAFMDVILPNMGLLSDTPFVYDNLILSSFIEIITFMFIMAREALRVYNEKEKLQSQLQAHQQKILESIVISQEEERNRVGRELHDSLGANMAIIKQQINKSNLILSSMVDKTIETIRNMSHGLVAPMTKNEELSDEFRELCFVMSNNDLEIKAYFYKWPQIESKIVATHLYRIVQELLQNAVKHSQAKTVSIQFMGEGTSSIEIIYVDDGIGFNPHKPSKKGLGFTNIINRLDLIQGKLQIDSKENGKGTTIIIEAKL